MFRSDKLASLLLLIWSVGASWFLARLMAGLMTLRRWRGVNIAAPSELRAITAAALDRWIVGRPVEVRLAIPEIRLQAPITWGIARPIVLLPEGYAQETNERWRVALLHGLAHVRRRDWAWLLLAQSLCALYWCVPFVWMAARRLNHETELACDDTVLSAGISAPDYAAQILEVVRNMQSENSRLPRIAMPMARRPLAEARIRAILDPTRQRQSNSRFVLILAALLPTLCMPILSLRVVAAQEARPAPHAAMRSASELSAPSNADLTSSPIETFPLTINKTSEQPSRPYSQRYNREGAEPDATSVSETGPVAPPLSVAPPPNEGQSAIAWGPVVNGLQAGLRLVRPSGAFAPGEPIWQETYLRNRSENEVIIRAIGGYESQGAPVLSNAKGARVKVLRFFGMGTMFVVDTRIQPGEMGLVGRFAVAFNRASEAKEVAPGLSSSAEETAIAMAGPGAYSLAQELSPLDAKGKPMQQTLRTGTVPIQIGNLPPKEIRLTDHNHYLDLSTAPIAWGATHSGLQVGLFVLGERSEFYVGERVRMAVILRNVSKSPISFWHQASFALMETPQIAGADGNPRTVVLAPETEWRTLSSIKMTGVTFDMTSAPSVDGPSYIRQSEIAPGQSILGYCLVGFTVPPHWPDGQAVPGRYHVSQPLRIGFGRDDQLDTTLETGGMELTFSDPDR